MVADPESLLKISLSMLQYCVIDSWFWNEYYCHAGTLNKKKSKNPKNIKTRPTQPSFLKQKLGNPGIFLPYEEMLCHSFTPSLIVYFVSTILLATGIAGEYV